MRELVNNQDLFVQIKEKLSNIENNRTNELIWEPFCKDFIYRFCWSSNAIEGNTLSLDETVSLIEYDEVRSGHTYTEYQEAKNLYAAIQMMIPAVKRRIDEEWIKKANGIIRGDFGEYRKKEVYIGSLTEVIYYPPNHLEVPGLMRQYMENVMFEENVIEDVIKEIARQHIRFERIHPFGDGNGRVGRMILNQQLINHGLLPVCINPKGSYRRSFRTYEKNGDTSLLVHEICKSEVSSIGRIESLVENYEKVHKKVKSQVRRR